MKSSSKTQMVASRAHHPSNHHFNRQLSPHLYELGLQFPFFLEYPEPALEAYQAVWQLIVFFATSKTFPSHSHPPICTLDFSGRGQHLYPNFS